MKRRRVMQQIILLSVRVPQDYHPRFDLLIVSYIILQCVNDTSVGKTHRPQ